ncbi:hypothetical protein FNV43_RR10310 [Rhamnella rubrinervis]|uniref:Uncharacterized protein n=1 Tax=Rhamnella rubrinervis TaxID=2594499 RepID=A0A8K0HBJ9_9ROSA|nr:hypothetical protein FNV43_RR10310 [Rhamnella rubrinervis]
MAPLKRLRKANDKSTKATIVTEVAATKKRSCEVEESSNALQTANLGYSSVKYAEASAKLAEGCPLIIYGILLGQISQVGVCPLVIYGYPQTRGEFGGCPLIIYGIPLSQIYRGIGQVGRKVSRRIIPEGAGDIAHLTVISNLQVAPKVIYDKLQKGIDQFEASIFGDFTRMKTVQFCGGFVHHLLLRQLYNDDSHMIEFEFNGIGARFDRRAFVMFIRLNCGKFPKESEMRNLSYSLWTKYFGVAEDLHDQFLDKADDKQYVRPPVVHVSAPSSVVPEPELEQEPVYTTQASIQSQPEGAPSQHLEGVINELREDFANIRADFGLQLAQ